MKKMLVLAIVFLFILVLANSVSAIEVSFEKQRISVPESQSVNIDLGYSAILLKWYDTKLILTIDGAATFENGQKFLEKGLGIIDENKKFVENIIVDETNPNVHDTIKITGILEYDLHFPKEIIKKESKTDSDSFIGIWTEKTQCVRQLEACEGSEILLQDENNVLKSDKTDLSIDLESTKIKLETKRSELTSCQTELAQTISPEFTLKDYINIFGIDLTVWLLLIIAFIVGIIAGDRYRNKVD